MRIATVGGSPRETKKQFLGWTLVESGATGIVETDADFGTEVFKVTGNGTTNGYSLLRKDLAATTSTLAIRLLVELGTTFTVASASMWMLKIYNAGLSLVGGFARSTAGVSIIRGINGSAVSPSSNGAMTVTGSFQEMWFFFKRHASAGSIGACGNVGDKSISRINMSYGTSSNDFSRLEVGVIPDSGGSFTGTLRIHEVDVFDCMPDEIGLLYESANQDFYAGVNAVIEVTVPAAESASQALTGLRIQGPGHADYEVFTSSVNGTRIDTTDGAVIPAPSAWLVDSGVFTQDDAYEGLFVKWTAEPFSMELPAQVMWTQASGTKAYLNRYSGALGVEDTTFTGGSQTCGLQTYTLCQEVTPDATNSPRKRWIAIPGSKLVVGQNTIRCTFGSTSVDRVVTVSSAAPPLSRVGERRKQGVSVVFGCDDNPLSQGQLIRGFVKALSPQPHLYSSVIVGLAGVYDSMTWSVLRLLYNHGLWPAGHLWDNNNLTTYTASVGTKLIKITRDVLMQHGYRPWMFVAPQGNWTSSDSANMALVALQYFGLARGSTGAWKTDWPADETTYVNSYSLYNGNLTGANDAARAADALSTATGRAFAGGQPDHTCVSINVHQIGPTNGIQTTLSLITAIHAEAVSRGFRVSSLFNETFYDREIVRSVAPQRGHR